MGYFVRRLLQIVPMLIAIATIVFFLAHSAPGGPVVALGGEFVTREYQAEIERLYGLDRPLLEQYLRFLALLLRGDLGQSYTFKAPVLDVVLSRMGATLLLAVPAIVVSALVGVWLGAVAARRGTAGGAVIATLLCHAVPVFWLGQLLLILLAGQAGLFPTHGMTDVRAGHSGLRHWLDVAHHLILPCLTLTLNQLAFTVLVSRVRFSDEMRRPYFTTALAKGLSVGGAQVRHAMPNAILPITVLIGSRVGWLISGAVLIENVFAWPGMGRLVVGATLSRDHPLIIGVVLVVAAVTLLANLAADLICGVIDPRIRQGKAVDGR